MLATSPTQHAKGSMTVTNVANTFTKMHVNTKKSKQDSTANKTHAANPTVKMSINTTKLKQESDALGKLFAHLKANIANSNKAQAVSKKDYAHEADIVQQRLDRDRKRLQQKNLSEFERPFLVNRTREEERELKYWTRQRDLNHGMFHNTLKMTHGLMSRVKTVMEAYQDVMKNGRIDPKLAEKLHAVSAVVHSA